MTSPKEGSGAAQYATVLSREADNFEKVNPSLPLYASLSFPFGGLSAHLRGLALSKRDIVHLVPGSKPPDTKFS
jgi:hypothetical protein